VREGRAQELIGAGSDHRRRLTAAMVEVAARHGYPGATVTQVVEVARVSRATFYDHFANRGECFAGAYREQLREAGSRVAAATGAVAPREWPEAVLEVLVEDLTANPDPTRFLLVEALGAPGVARDEHEETIARTGRLVGAFLDEQASAGAIQLPATALIAGVVDVLARRALLDGEVNPWTLQAELSFWIDTYRLKDGVQPLPQRRWRELGRFAKPVAAEGAAEPALLPRGRSALPEEDSAAVRRRRILDATARLCCEVGYSSLTVAQIATAARVPRAAFYSLFDGKQEALMAAQTHGLEAAMAVAAPAYSAPAPWPRRVWNMAQAFLTYLAEAPHYAHMDFVESYAAGSAAVRHRQQNHMVFTLFLEDGYRECPAARRLPSACMEAVAGGVLGLVRKLLVEGKSERMLSLLPAMGYTILAPFIGPETAAEQVQAWSRGAR
jgi:AcrR family transcriptional regulator